ncbi:MAG: LuxR C-terminal-related transcriptional regulator [Bacteroidales bacterium]
MLKDYGPYNLFFEFKKAYSSVGFNGIDRHDPFIRSLEEMMEENRQFLSVFDMLHMKTLFVSQGCMKMLGVQPEDLTSYHLKEATHPDDLKRAELGLVKLFKTAHELFVAKKGEMVISTNFRMRSPERNYINQLIQCYLFYGLVPAEAVYMIHINTDISWCKKMKHGYHYYVGNDLSYFRYPDDELLLTGNIFTEREFEIIKLVQEGLDSEGIAEKLFLSKHTVKTHRKNILEKTGKAHISELIYDLHERGLL